MLAHSDEGSGPAIVFLHGISGNRDRWLPISKRLTDQRRCVRVDLPGHGASPAEGCDLVSASAKVQELIDLLGLERPLVVGHSMGANLALVHAALYGGAGAVAVDGAPFHLPHFAASIAPFHDRLVGDDFTAAFADWEQSFGAPPGIVHDVTQDVVLSYWASILTPEAAETSQPVFASALQAITVPVLLLLAAPPTPEDQDVIDLMSTATVEVWPGGHFLHLADADRFAAKLLELT